MKGHEQAKKEIEFISRLEKLQSVPHRNPQTAAEGRASYLIQVQNLAKTRTSFLPVSITGKWRLNGWIESIINLLQKKERFPMFTTISSIAIVLALLFGGAGATVYAAQGSQPNDALYQLKLFSEDMRQEVASSQQEQLELSLAFSERRMGEISDALGNGEELPEPVMERLQEHLRDACKAIAGMPDAEMEEALQQMRERIQERIQEQEQLGSQIGALERVREILREQVRIAEEGLQDPNAFRWQYQNEAQEGFLQNPGEGNPDNGQGKGNGGKTHGLGTDAGKESQTGAYPGPEEIPQAKPIEIGPQGKSNSQGYGPGPGTQEPQENQGFGPGPNTDPGNEAFGPHSTMITTTEEVDNPLGLGTGSGQDPNKTGGEKEKKTDSNKSNGGESGYGKNSR